MTEEVTPQSTAAIYTQAIATLEGELAGLELIKVLDERPKLRIETALEDLRKKLAAVQN
jgi:hypothetical protein